MNSKLISILATAIISISSFANTPDLIINPTENASTFNITYTASEKGKVSIKIYDQHNVVVYYETLNNIGSFTRPYNFKGMPSGEYTVVVESAEGKQAEKIDFQLNKVESFIRIAEVKDQENKYWMIVANNGAENVNVRILNAEGSILYNNTLTVNGNHSVVYNLNKIKRTNEKVTFQVTTESRTETITF